MELKLKERKRIKNGLPGFRNGDDSRFYDWNSYQNQIGAGSEWEGVDLSPKPIILDKGPLAPEVYDGAQTNQEKRIKAPDVAKLNPWAALGAMAAEGVGNGLLAANKSADSFLADAGVSQGSVSGFGYQKQNYVDTSRQLKDYNRDTALSFLTNPVEGITRLFGRHQFEKRMRQANNRAQLANTYNRSGALSDYLGQQYASKYGNDESQMLWAAAEGKDAVESSVGQINVQPNARTEDGEIIFNDISQTARNIPGKTKGDKNLSILKPSDVVLTNMYGISDEVRKPAIALEYANKHEHDKLRMDLGKRTDAFVKKITIPVLEQSAQKMKLYRQLGMLMNPTQMKAKSGKDKLPGFVGGNNWQVDGLGVATGLGQLFSSAFQRVKKPNTYVSNPYANAALTGLAGLNINPYPMMQQMRDQENRNLYQINRAGGLSGAQKAYANIATGIGTQRNIADLGANIQAQNNQYKTNYYSTLLNAGQADRAARIGANQYDLDYYSKAHAAKLQMAQMGIYNMLNSLQQGYANAFKRNQFNKTYDLYAQDAALNKKKTNAEIANMKRRV